MKNRKNINGAWGTQESVRGGRADPGHKPIAMMVYFLPPIPFSLSLPFLLYSCISHDGLLLSSCTSCESHLSKRFLSFHLTALSFPLHSHSPRLLGSSPLHTELCILCLPACSSEHCRRSPHANPQPSHSQSPERPQSREGALPSPPASADPTGPSHLHCNNLQIHTKALKPAVLTLAVH